MRYLKLFENYREDIDSICYKYEIEDYTINSDGSIDVDGDVDISFVNTTLSQTLRSSDRLINLPIVFRNVSGDFDCDNHRIRTFEGFPSNLGGDFTCFNNPVYQLWVLFEDKEKVGLFNDFGITDGEVVILQRLNDFLEMIGKPIVTDQDQYCLSKLEKNGYKII